MLALPISEFFSSETGWQLVPEHPYRKLDGASTFPDFWCDFAASRKYGEGMRFILEAKYLKSQASNLASRVVADIVRLSMPTSVGLKRYFLLAGASEYFPDASEEFLFGKRMFGAKGFYASPKHEVGKLEQNSTYSGSYPAAWK